jgi:GR25 family glycosyltransferase involved in LPS biosynthesis
MFDYTDYDIFWINCSENKGRYNHMKEILEKNFSNHRCHHIEAIMHKPKYNGITMAHMVAVMKGMTLGKPFLILEDDIIGGGDDKSFVTTPCKSSSISKEECGVETDVREKCVEKEKPDAIYLGLSYWGNMKMGRKKLLAECMEKDEKVVLINNKVFMKKGARGEDWDDKFFRIRDMYGAHAILYISKQYMIETLKICILAVSENKPHDIYLPKLQKKYLVLGQKYPTFYQYEKLGGQENGTKINFSGVRKITS